MSALIANLRSGAWVTRERTRLVAGLILAFALIGMAFLVVTSDGRNDRFGRPLGTDFSNVYAAGTYVLDGEATAPFDPHRQYLREQAIFGKDTPFYGWHYPPFFLGLAALLALMPYGLALAMWQSVTLVLYLLAIRAILASFLPAPLWEVSRAKSARGGVADENKEITPSRSRSAGSTSPLQGEVKTDWLLLALAFPAVFINIGHGHNGFLTAALFAAGLLLIDRRPWIAGILFGCLAYKPQFGVLIPLVLAASGRWRVFASATLTVAALALAVTLAFGVDVWSAFAASTKFTRTVVLEQGATGWQKIQSVFSVVRMWGGSIPLAYAAQIVTALGVAASLVWLWRSRAAFALKAAALLIGTVLVTPYSLDYDLVLLAPAIAWCAVDGIERGFAPWQKTILAILWLMPLIARTLAQATLIPLAVPSMLVAFAFILRCAMVDNPAPAPWRFAMRTLK